MVVHVYNPSNKEAEVGGGWNIPRQSELHSKTLFQNKIKQKNQTKKTLVG
jgi:hypothetical protein